MSEEQFAFLIGLACGALVGGLIVAKAIAFMVAYYILKLGKSVDQLARDRFASEMRKRGK